MKTHTSSLLTAMPKYIHTDMEPIYTNAATRAMVIYMHIYIYMHISIPISFTPSLGSYKVDFFGLFSINF